jgi:hypothetical protein
VRGSWAEILAAVSREQAGRDALRVALYACTPLQWIDPAREPAPALAPAAALAGARSRAR